ncbi:MAG: MFS transporter, partial [Thermoplasmata archaeon]|nr:MFS transporter [Thermoplasmata archaeon]
QVPSGLLARRFGTRWVSLVGAALLGAAAVASAFSPSYLALVALRGVAGAGAGLFFSPAIALVGSLHPEGHRGVPVGVFSSAFSAGAGLGVFASALLIPYIGWRGALLVGGVALLALVVPSVLAIPPTVGRPVHRPGRSALPYALRSPAVWAMGISFIGLEGASLSAGQYFVPFAESVHGWTPALAGAIGALFVFPSVVGGPVGGRLTERSYRRRTQMIVATALPAALLLFVPFVGLGETAAIGIGFSVSYGMVYAMMYVLAPYLPGIPTEEVPLAIGLFNGIQLCGGAAIAFAAALVVGTWGYSWAWTVLGVA